MKDTHIVTIERHIIEEERRRPAASGVFSNILSDMALAAKVISRQVNMAGLIDVLGKTGESNIQGEAVEKLDVFAQSVIYRAMDHTGYLCCMVSEEVEGFIPIPEKFPAGEYVLVFDPLDGSSNIDVNVSIGTVFAIYRKCSDTERGSLEDCLQGGRKQLAAGYIVYGSSTRRSENSSSATRTSESPNLPCGATRRTRRMRPAGPRESAVSWITSGMAIRRRVGATIRRATSARWWPTSTESCCEGGSSFIRATGIAPKGNSGCSTKRIRWP
jgi:fructose-1,6-bisphosphatase/inositol monophosphatase family enzyme